MKFFICIPFPEGKFSLEKEKKEFFLQKKIKPFFPLPLTRKSAPYKCYAVWSHRRVDPYLFPKKEKVRAAWGVIVPRSARSDACILPSGASPTTAFLSSHTSGN